MENQEVKQIPYHQKMEIWVEYFIYLIQRKQASLYSFIELPTGSSLVQKFLLLQTFSLKYMSEHLIEWIHRTRTHARHRLLHKPLALPFYQEISDIKQNLELKFYMS